MIVSEVVRAIMSKGPSRFRLGTCQPPKVGRWVMGGKSPAWVARGAMHKLLGALPRLGKSRSQLGSEWIFPLRDAFKSFSAHTSRYLPLTPMPAQQGFLVPPP